MSGRTGMHWKKPATRMYDYNYNLGEHYYQPLLTHLDTKRSGRSSSPPGAKTFAERFAAKPVYGNLEALNYRNSEMSMKSCLRRSSLNEESSMAAADERRKLIFGDRLLESAGVSGSTSALASSDNCFDEAFMARRKMAAQRSQEAESMIESSLLRGRTKKAAAEELMDEMKKEVDSSSSKFRARLRARAEAEESDAAHAAIAESRADQIRSRARARLAELNDDVSALAIRGSSASASLRSRQESSQQSSASSAMQSSRTIRVTKRTIKTTIES